MFNNEYCEIRSLSGDELAAVSTVVSLHSCRDTRSLNVFVKGAVLSPPAGLDTNLLFTLQHLSITGGEKYHTSSSGDLMFERGAICVWY